MTTRVFWTKYGGLPTARRTPSKETPEGFDLRVDIIEPRWIALLYEQQTRYIFTYHVRLKSDGTFTITDDEQELSWQAGDPESDDPRPVVGPRKRIVGRKYTVRTRKTYEIDPQGGIRKVGEFRFRSTDGHELIRSVAREFGLCEKMPTPAKVGLVFGIAGGVAGLAVGVASLVVALL
jgi:hypothetical protein